jgi:predicted regulator of Ras-like GTPase activity (Roadblock/LC7/MglB family)
MDAASALADLLEISSQVETAVVLGEDGAPVASSAADPESTERLAAAGRDLLAAADESTATGDRTLTQLEVALAHGSVFAVRDGGRAIVATTSARPTSGLVFYDLKTCLRALADAEAPKAKPRRARKAEPADA